MARERSYKPLLLHKNVSRFPACRVRNSQTQGNDISTYQPVGNTVSKSNCMRGIDDCKHGKDPQGSVCLWGDWEIVIGYLGADEKSH